MSKSLLDTIQTGIHSTSLFILGITVIVIAVAIVRPQLFKRLFLSFSERKYLITCGVFIALLSGTIFVATEPMQERSYVSENNKKTIQSVDSLEQQPDNHQEIIKTEEVATTEVIPYTQQRTNDPSLAKGETQLVQSGVNGQKTIVYTITYQNNTEVTRTLKSETVDVAAKPEIIANGTYVAAPAQPQPTTPSAAANPSNPTQAPAPPTPTPNKSESHSICKNSRSWICSWFR